MNETSAPNASDRPGATLDPVCGSRILDPDEANQFHDGTWTHHFCSAMCRRIFIDELRARRAAETKGEPWVH